MAYTAMAYVVMAYGWPEDVGQSCPRLAAERFQNRAEVFDDGGLDQARGVLDHERSDDSVQQHVDASLRRVGLGCDGLARHLAY